MNIVYKSIQLLFNGRSLNVDDAVLVYGRGDIYFIKEILSKDYVIIKKIGIFNEQIFKIKDLIKLEYSLINNFYLN